MLGITPEEVADESVKTSQATSDQNKPKDEFYDKAKKYWSEVPATVNGMLGGLGYINALDIQCSQQFLRELKIKDGNKKYALDCGAGIGRVTKNLLMPIFDTVDMVEQDPTFAQKASDYCTQNSGTALANPNKLGEIYNVGLQEFIPSPRKYDVIWSQW